jgi:hypothetical protein
MPEALLIKSFYAPARGGHAPGDVRDAFVEAVDAYEAWEDGTPEPTVDVRDQPIRISVVCGLVWNCTDVMPGRLYDHLANLVRWPEDMTQRRTYAAGARLLKSMIKGAS